MNRSGSFRSFALWLPALALSAAALGGCSSTNAVTGPDDDLTSLTARSRRLTFSGYVFVEPGASDDAILREVQRQTQTAFGALRTSEIAVNSRELKDVDPATFRKKEVDVIDTDDAAAEPAKMLRVSYRYSDNAVVPISMSRRSAISIAVMGRDYRAQTSRVLEECTPNDSHARDFQTSLWYIFDPSSSRCRSAIAAEQEQIDAAREKVPAGGDAVPLVEVNRLYLPVTARLGADRTNRGDSYPEYDRLYAGGIEPDTLIVGMVNGFIGHDAEDHTDFGYGEWMTQLREAMAGHPDFDLVRSDPEVDLRTFDIGDKHLENVSIAQIFDWNRGWSATRPDGFSSAEFEELKAEIGRRVIRHWLTFESKVNVQIGDAPAKEVTLRIQTYFGAGRDSTPHKRAIKTSDIFLYNGHSYIGYGPLDPSRFAPEDFPTSYQILFVDGCVSYNYYERDYIPLKEGGTQNLDLITNGLEAPAWRSGEALGRFTQLLIDGKSHSYLELLEVARATDELRVVDGELDNAYSPAETPITMSAR